MIGGYKKGVEYEYETSLGITYKLNFIRLSKQYVWFWYDTKKTRRVLKIKRKDEKWKKRLREISHKSLKNY